jgi:hypothetical protein
MRLADILGTILLLLWPYASIARSVHTVADWQSTQSQENPQSNSSPQNSAGQLPTDRQETSDQSAAPPQPPTTASSPCPGNLHADSSVNPDCKPTESTGSKAKKHHRAHKAGATAGTTTETGSAKTVIRNGGTADPAVDLSPRLNQQQASHQIEITNQLLATSGANLKKLSGRQLSTNQQDTVKQVKSYMQQAKLAANDGDVHRAYNLALKANLLSAELVGH